MAIHWLNVGVMALCTAAISFWVTGHRAGALCETPQNTSVKVFLPFNESLTDHSNQMVGELTNQGYTLTNTYKDDDDDDDDPETSTVFHYDLHVLRPGVSFWLHTHGGATGQSIEVYTTETARDNRWNELVPTYFAATDLYKAYVSDKYTISAHCGAGGLIDDSCASRKQIIFLATCYSSNHFGVYKSLSLKPLRSATHSR